MERNSSSGLVFIDVDAKSSTAIVKEERASSPDEQILEKKSEAEKRCCTLCNHFTCYSAERMTRHIRMHRGENPYQCSMCDYSTYNSVMFQEHVNIHRGIKPYKCIHCPYRSVSKKYIKLHEQKHGTCSKCGFVANNRPALRRHRRENGCEPDEKKDVYTCNACGNDYELYVSLLQHKKRYRKCTQCDKSFCQPAMTAHMTTEHGVAEKVRKRKFECAQCKWGSNIVQKILLHMIHHPKQKLDGSIDVTPLIRTGILNKLA